MRAYYILMQRQYSNYQAMAFVAKELKEDTA